MKYNKARIVDLCTLVTSGGTPLTSVPDYYDPKEIPWLKTGEVNYCRIYNTESFISKEGLAHSSAKLIPSNSVIVAMYGQGDTAGRVAINKIPVSTNQACCNLIINHDIADYEYVYYALYSLYDHLVALKNGGAQPNLNAKKIKAVEIPFPDLEIQHKIASILSAYDDLIDNNKKQIKLLEEATQRLYKEWFVDLRFPGYEDTPVLEGVPEEWPDGNLGDIAVFKRGKTITKAQVREGNIPVVAGGLEPAYYHNKANTVAPVITVSGSGANAGFARLYNVDVFASDCSFVDSETTPYLFFVYCYLKANKSSLNSLQKGSAQPHVYPKDLNAMKLKVPTDKFLCEFCYLVAPFFKRMKTLQREIACLSEARDRLIPKLMNSEIEVC